MLYTCTSEVQQAWEKNQGKHKSGYNLLHDFCMLTNSCYTHQL